MTSMKKTKHLENEDISKMLSKQLNCKIGPESVGTVPAELVAECLHKKNAYPLYKHGVDGSLAREISKKMIDGLLDELVLKGDVSRQQADGFLDSLEHEMLLDGAAIYYMEQSRKIAFMNTTVQGRVTILSNYDSWSPLWSSGGLYGTEDALVGMMRSLSLNPARVKQEAEKRGLRCYRNFPKIISREGNEVVDYEDFVTCLIECPNQGLWTFMGEFDMEALWETDCNPSKLVIPRGTTCTVFNDWSGGGSCYVIKTLRDLPYRKLMQRARTEYDRPTIYVDEKLSQTCEYNHGYSTKEVYGRPLSTNKLLVLPSRRT